MKAVVAIALAVFLSACASSPYTYYVEPTPIKKQETVYRIAEVNVDLTLGHGAIPGDDSFADKVELQKQFSQYLESALDNKGILAQEGEDSLEITVNIDYKRTFNHGGKALNKPEVSHVVTIFGAGKKLASFAENRYTTKYGYFEDMAVNLEIAAFSWDEEDEPRDIEVISNLIIEDLANLGS